jgi:hypothetical protein
VALQPFVGPWSLLQFRNHFTQLVGLLGRGISPSQGHYLHTQDNTNTEQTHTQTSMPWVGFEPTIPAFKRAKTVHALDRAGTVIRLLLPYFTEQRGTVGDISLLSWELPGSNLGKKTSHPEWGSNGLPKSLEIICIYILPIRYPLVVLPFDAVQTGLLRLQHKGHKHD